MIFSRFIIRKLNILAPQKSIISRGANRYSPVKVLIDSNYCCHYSTMAKFKVLIVNETVPSVATEVFKTDCDVIVCEEDRASVLRAINGVDALFWATYDIRIDKNLLDAAGPNLKAVATMSAGYDNIDVDELKARGIKFGNTPGVVGSAVAEQAIMLALAASRRVVEARLAIENAEWSNKFDTQWLEGMEIAGSVVGIVGLGSIGQAIANKLKGFEVARFLYTGRKPKPEGLSVLAGMSTEYGIVGYVANVISNMLL